MRGALPGGALFAAVAISGLWAGFSALEAQGGMPFAGTIAIALDVIRGGAWYVFLIVLSRPLWGRWMRWPGAKFPGPTSGRPRNMGPCTWRVSWPRV